MRGELKFCVVLLLISIFIWGCNTNSTKASADDFYDAANNYSAAQNPDAYQKVPDLDNPETITGILQKRYPDKTIINAAKWGYSIDDELSQWTQRTKYTEPDIVILQVSGLNTEFVF